MSAAPGVQGTVIDSDRYEIVRRDREAGVVIVKDSRGRAELWERVIGYRGEIMVIDGEEYRFSRSWRGARGRN